MGTPKVIKGQRWYTAFRDDGTSELFRCEKEAKEWSLRLDEQRFHSLPARPSFELEETEVEETPEVEPCEEGDSTKESDLAPDPTGWKDCDSDSEGLIEQIQKRIFDVRGTGTFKKCQDGTWKIKPDPHQKIRYGDITEAYRKTGRPVYMRVWTEEAGLYEFENISYIQVGERRDRLRWMFYLWGCPNKCSDSVLTALDDVCFEPPYSLVHDS